jgi:hypothetical protein
VVRFPVGARYFLYSTPALGHTQPPVEQVPAVFSPRFKARGVNLTSKPPPKIKWKYRIIETVHLPQLHASLSCKDTTCTTNLWRCGSWPIKGKCSPRCECSNFATYYDFGWSRTKLRHFVWRPSYICNIWPLLYLGALAKLRKANVSFVMSVGLYVRMKHLSSNWTDIREILFNYF